MPDYGFITKNTSGGTQVDSRYANYALVEWGEVDRPSGEGYQNTGPNETDMADYNTYNFAYSYPWDSSDPGSSMPLVLMKAGLAGSTESPTNAAVQPIVFGRFLLSGGNITGFTYMKSKHTDLYGQEFQVKVYYPTDAIIDNNLIDLDDTIDNFGITVLRPNGGVAFDSRFNYLKIKTIEGYTGNSGCNAGNYAQYSMGIYINHPVQYDWCSNQIQTQNAQGSNTNIQYSEGIGAHEYGLDDGSYSYHINHGTVGGTEYHEWAWYSVNNIGGGTGARQLKNAYSNYSYANHRAQMNWWFPGIRNSHAGGTYVAHGLGVFRNQNNSTSYQFPHNAGTVKGNMIIAYGDHLDEFRHQGGGQGALVTDNNAFFKLQNAYQDNWKPSEGFHDDNSVDFDPSPDWQDDNRTRIFPMTFQMKFAEIENATSYRVYHKLHWQFGHGGAGWGQNPWAYNLGGETATCSNNYCHFDWVFSDINVNVKYKAEFVIKAYDSAGACIYISEPNWMNFGSPCNGQPNGEQTQSAVDVFGYWSPVNGRNLSWVYRNDWHRYWFYDKVMWFSRIYSVGPNSSCASEAQQQSGQWHDIAPQQATWQDAVLNWKSYSSHTLTHATDAMGDPPGENIIHVIANAHKIYTGLLDGGIAEHGDDGEYVCNDHVKVDYRYVPVVYVNGDTDYPIYGDYIMVDFNVTGGNLSNSLNYMRVQLPNLGGGGDGCGSSDILQKYDIERVGQSKSGINIYEFSYINKEKYGSGRYRGVLAHEVPKATFLHRDGTQWVNYNKIDVKFEKI